ncbi:MAG TPA: universal stress protein [Rubrobacteraceae bacterium]|nr:universal stress protein [Rubrobacteraceae bacterium]
MLVPQRELIPEKTASYPRQLRTLYIFLYIRSAYFGPFYVSATNRRPVLGRVTDIVVRSAHCPVLVVHGDGVSLGSPT